MTFLLKILLFASFSEIIFIEVGAKSIDTNSDESMDQTQFEMENQAIIDKIEADFLNMNDTETRSILSQITSIFSDRINIETMETQYILAWVNAAMAKCARIDPALITAVFPSSINGLREPRMYYFENSTFNKLTWKESQHWCSARGMNLLTVYSAAENKIIQQKLEAILGSIVATGTDINRFWIGLNDAATTNGNFKYIGDASSTFTDWGSGFPVATLSCVSYTQRDSAANIHMENLACGVTIKHRFICEVSPECTALFMSRYKNPLYVNYNQN